MIDIDNPISIHFRCGLLRETTLYWVIYSGKCSP